MRAWAKSFCGRVEVQDAAPLEVEVDALALRHLEEHLAGGDRQPHGLDGVLLVVRDVRQELGHPADLVQRRRRVDEQRRVGLQHPLQALHHGAPLRPGLGVRGRELAAVGEARLHRGIAVAVEHRHLEPAVEERVGGRQAGHAGADHGNLGHGNTPRPLAASLSRARPLRAWNLRDSPPIIGMGLLLRWALAGRFPECLRPCRSLDLRVSGAVAPSAAGHPAFSRHVPLRQQRLPDRADSRNSRSADAGYRLRPLQPTPPDARFRFVMAFRVAETSARPSHATPLDNLQDHRPESSEPVMPTTHETILSARHALLQTQGRPGARDEILPERVPAVGLLILRDGDPGEPAVTLSRSAITTSTASRSRRSFRPALAVTRRSTRCCARSAQHSPPTGRSVGSAIGSRPRRPPVDLAIDGAATLKAAVVPIVLHYASADPLG